MPKRLAPVCIVTPEFPGPMRCGGLGTAVYWQARALAAAGIQVDVLLTGDIETGTADRWARRLRMELGIRFVHAEQWIARERDAMMQLRFGPDVPGVVQGQWVLEFLRAHRYGLVYLQDYLGHGMVALQARAAGLAFEDTTFVTTVHGPTRWAYEGLEMFAPSQNTFVIDHQEKTSVLLADHVIAPSAYMRQWLRDTWQVARQDVEVLPYCFDTPAAGRAVGVHGPFRHLVFFGRLETRKGLEMFLDSITRSPALRRSVRKVSFLGKSGLVSGRTGRDLIETALVDESAFDWQILDDKDTFQAWDWLGRQRDILVVAPSLSDNLPYAVIELFLRRIPFLTTDAGGIPEIVGNNPSALCAPTAPALRERLEHIVSEGRLTISHRTGYDPRKAVKANIDACRRLTKRRVPRPTAVRASRPGLRRHARPEISVILTHFNYGGYLPYALRSLAAQRCDVPYEVLVIDDASTRPDHRDAFLAASREYAGDSRFRFFAETTNRGAGGARNFGVTKARGRFLVFFDADNEALPDFLATYHRAIETSGCDVMTCYLAQVRQDDYESPRPIDTGRTDYVYAPPGGGVEAGFLMNIFGDTCAIFRKQAFIRIGGFSSDSSWYRQLPSGDWDWDLFAKASLAGCRMGVVPQILFRYRFSSANQQSYNLRWRYRLRSIINARYSSNDARQRVDWHWLFGLFETHRTSSSASSAQGHYEYLAGASDERLLALTGRGPGTANDETIRRLRARLLPLVATWRHTRPRVMLYGAGLHTRVMLGVVPELAEFVTGVIDRQPLKDFLRWPALKPEQFRPDLCDVIVYSSKEYERMMHANLAHHPVEHVLIYNEMASSRAAGDAVTKGSHRRRRSA